MNVQHLSRVIHGNFAEGRDGSIELVACAKIDPDNLFGDVISFYMQFYAKAMRDAYQDRIINFHPSLLPAFKGMDGFGDGMAYHAKIIGTTVEFIKDVMDEGKIIMQTACAVNPNWDLAAMRHRIFVQQCKSLIQVAKWIVQDRVKVIGDKVVIGGASYQDVEFSPALEFHEAMNLRIPSISA